MMITVCDEDGNELEGYKSIRIFGDSVDRKVEFETELANCKALESNDERFSCYEKLKVNQFKQNTDYNARMEAKMNATAGIPEMQNRTDTMLPINNYINTFSRYMPNEIR